jgi:integrase
MADGTGRRANDDARPYWNESRQRWELFIELPRDADGRRRRKKLSGRTKADVRAAAKEARRAIALGRTSSTQVTVAGHLDAWIHDALPGRVSPSTVDIYARTARLYIIPYVGAVRLTALDTTHVERMMRRLAAEGRSAATIRLARRVLGRSLRAAQQARRIDRNVAAPTDGPRMPRREARTFTPGDARALLDATRATPDAAAVWTLLTTGLCRGELLGLCWDDVDLDAGALTVRRQLQRRSSGLVLDSDLKSGRSHRRVVLLGPVVDLLRSHRAQQAADRLLLGPEWSSFAVEHGGLVFTTVKGGPLDAGNWRKRFGRLCRDAGLDVTNPHAARHGVASTLFAMGIPTPVIADLLGHASPQVTEQVYVHLLGPAREDAAEALGRALFGELSG